MHSPEDMYTKADNLIRISCQAVQGVFRDTWKQITGNDWTEESAQKFINGEGKVFYSTCKPIQKRLLETGNIEEWDLTLLYGVFHHCLSTQNDNGTWKRRKIALQKLCTERNELAHKVQRKITAEAYQQVEDSVRKSLSALGIRGSQIDKWISQAGVTSWVGALEHAKKIQMLGDEEFSKGNYQDAVKHYDDALLIPSLLPGNLCTLYEQRAACYLEMGKHETSPMIQNGLYDQAMTDIKEALNNNANSWKAHFILAKICRKRHELEEAIEHFTRALAICPSQTSVKEELDDCKLLNGSLISEDHMNPRILYGSSGEMCYPQSIGLHLIPKNIQKCLKDAKKMDALPGQRNVYLGYQFLNGWDCRRSEKEAAQHFAKAMAKGNAEGIYNLAMLYQEGKGVHKDLPYAIELLKKAANMPEKIKVEEISNVDRGVQFAQHALAMKYQQGIGVEKDYKKAAELYTKAVNTGMNQAANNLAVLYYHGKGVDQDSKRAEMLWKKSAESGDTVAAQSLCAYYLDEMEPDLATLWLNKAIELGHLRLPFLKDSFMTQNDHQRKMRESLEEEVIIFEKDHGLDKHGLTFRQRGKRMQVAGVYQQTMATARGKDSGSAEKEATECSQQCANLMECLEIWNGEKKEFQDCITKILSADKYQLGTKDVEILARRVEEGSVSALRMLAVYQFNLELIPLLEGDAQFSEERAKRIIELAYHICGTHHCQILFSSQEIFSRFKRFIKAQFQAHCDEKGDMDKKIRLCYAVFVNDGGDQFELEVLKEGVRRYPDELMYYYMLAAFYAMKHDYAAGLEITNKALDRFPNSVDLLFSKARHTHNFGKGKRFQVKVRAYQDFINAAPEDHPQLPEAYYSLAFIYSGESRGSGKDAAEQKVLEFYEMAKCAEEKQLPCDLPYESPNKAFTTLAVMKIKSSKLEDKDNAKECDATQRKGGKLPMFLTTPSRDYLKDPKRIEIRKDHRTQQIRALKVLKTMNPVRLSYSVEPSLQQKSPKHLIGLQAIFLQGMDPMSDKVYENKILNLTIIENPIMYCYAGIHMVAMDDNKDVVRFSIYNLPHNELVRRMLAPGCKFSVINPYMRVAVDGRNAIRVDEPKCIFDMEERVEKMCIYCGQENSTYKCGKCGWANYCSKDCQMADWKELKHKLICK